MSLPVSRFSRFLKLCIPLSALIACDAAIVAKKQKATAHFNTESADAQLATEKPIEAQAAALVCGADSKVDPNDPKQCISTKELVCPSGQKNEKGECVTTITTCPNGGTPSTADPTKCEVPSPQVVCKEGSTLDKGVCIMDPVCPAGSVKSADGASCALPTACPAGSIVDPKNSNSCIINKTSCPANTVADATSGACVQAPTCPNGAQPDTQGQCAGAISCPQGSQKSTDGLACLLAVTCPEGSELDPKNNQQCIGKPLAATCTNGTLDSTGHCVMAPSCTTGTLDPTNSKCVMPVVNVATCPEGATQDPTTNVCQYPIGCPSGATLTGGKCVADQVQCPQGSNKNSDGKCIEIDPGTVCKDNTAPVDGVCFIPPVCKEPAHMMNGVCVLPSSCPQGTLASGANCLLQSQCPEGSTMAQGGICVENQVQCSQEAHDAGAIIIAGLCIMPPTCPPGTTPTLNKDPALPPACYFTAQVPPCIYTLINGVCQIPPTCQTGTFDEKTQSCLIPVTQVGICPQGATMNQTTKQCEFSAQCPKGSQIDPNNSNQCLFTVVAVTVCPEGATMNQTTKQCELKPSCPQNSQVQTDGTCLSSTPPLCPDSSSTYDSTKKVCIYKATCADGSAPNAKGQCLLAWVCANGTAPDAKGKCLIPWTCQDGSTPVNGACMAPVVPSKNCPAGSAGSCFEKSFKVQDYQAGVQADFVVAVDQSSSMKEEKQWVGSKLFQMLKIFFVTNQFNPDLFHFYFMTGNSYTLSGDSTFNIDQFIAQHPNTLVFLPTYIGSHDALEQIYKFFQDGTQSKNVSPTSKKEILVISDDNSYMGALDFVVRMEGLTGRGIKGNTRMNGFVSLTGSTKVSGCSPEKQGSVYLNFSNDPKISSNVDFPPWKGYMGELCSTNWDVLFQNLAKTIVTHSLSKDFTLDKPVDRTKPVRLFINEVEKVMGSDKDFVVLTDKNTLHLNDSVQVTKDDAIRIVYYGK